MRNGIEAELRKLERSNKLLGFAVAGLLGLALLGLGSAQQAAETLRVSSLEIVDDNGKVRCSIKPEGYGAALILYGSDGRQRLAVRADHRTAAILFQDEHGAQSMVLGRTDDFLGLSFPEISGRSAKIELHPDGPVMELRDRRTGKAELAVTGEVPTFRLMDKDGRLLFKAPTQ